MRKFKIVSDFKPTGDQPQAIEKLAEGIVEGLQHQVLLGNNRMKGDTLLKKIFCGVILLLAAFVSSALAIPRPEPEPTQEKTVVASRQMFFGVIETVDLIGNTIVVRSMMADKRTLTFVVGSRTVIISKKTNSLFLRDVKKGMQVTVEYQEEKGRLNALSIEVTGP